MKPPQRNAATSNQQLFVFWETISLPDQTGDSAISSYGLEYDNGSSGATWYPLTGYEVNSLETSFIVSGVTEGTIY